MKFINKIAMALVLGIAVSGLMACEQGPAENAGASIDNAAQEASDKLKEASDKIKDAVKVDDKN